MYLWLYWYAVYPNIPRNIQTLWLEPILTLELMHTHGHSHFHAMQTYHVVWGKFQKHRQYSWYSFSYLLSKPLPLTAVCTTAVCLFQKHNIAIICQLIPAWTTCIVNSLQHTQSREHSHSFSLRGTRTQLQNKLAHLATDPAISALCPR